MEESRRRYKGTVSAEIADFKVQNIFVSRSNVLHVDPECGQCADSTVEPRSKYEEEMSEYKKTPSYAAHQERLRQWKEEQEQSDPSTQSKNTKKSTVKTIATKKAMDPEHVRLKVDSFFKTYRTKASKAPWPKGYVSDAYGTAMEKSSKWITAELVTKQQNFSGAITAFGRMITVKPNIDKMDFSWGGPGYELGVAMEEIENLLKLEHFKENVKRSAVKTLFGKLQSFYALWNDYCLGDGIKSTVELIAKEWTF